MRKSTLQEKIDENIWDHLQDFFPVYHKMRKGKWKWINNTKCKYVELRIDMRDGGCIISDRDGNRISPEELAWQNNPDELNDLGRFG